MKLFFRNILVIDIVALILSIALIYPFFGIIASMGFLLAFLITTINSLAGYYFIDKYLNAPISEFMTKIIGGMMIRLLLLLLVFFLIVLITPIPEITFTVSLFISYISKSILEINFINKRSAKSSN